jgi:hypothetical protein
MQMTIEVRNNNIPSSGPLIRPECGNMRRQAISQPDCRGCKNFGLCYFSAEGLICTNGDKFQALPKVMLYKVT